MTKKFTLAFALLTAISGFAQEYAFPTQEFVLQETKTLPVDTFKTVESNRRDINKKGSIYFRALTDSEPNKGPEIFPGFGLGYRMSFSNSAVDISANYSFGEVNRRHQFWTAPKVSYLHYVSADSDQSLYGGIGLAWGETRSRSDDGTNKSRFRGLIPHITVGYELLRHSQIFSFTELTLSQPLFPSNQQGKRPGIIGELSLGAGF